MEKSSSVSPENAGGPFSFKVGEEGFGFDGKFTKGRFTGIIRGADGKEFAGLVEDLGGGRYRVEDNEDGRIIESPAEALAVEPLKVPVGGLEDAAALAAIDAAPTAPAEPVAGPTPEQVAEDIERTRMGMAAPPDEEVRAVAEEPAEADLAPSPAPEPQLEIGHVFELSPVPEPDIVAAVEAGQRMTVAEARQKFDQEFRDLDARAREARYDSGQKNSLQQRAQELRTGAEKARSRVNKLRNKDRIAEAISEEGRLIAEAKKLEEQAAAITALEDTEIQAIEDRRQRARDLTQEVDRWGNLIENPALIEEYRGLDGRMQEDLAAAEKLFGGGNPEDQQVLDAARRRIEERTQARRTELQAMFPRRYMELAGMAPRQELSDAAVDYTLDRDLIERYYQFADQFYSELTGGPRAVAVEIPQSVEPQSAPELTAAAEVEEISPAGQAPEAVEEHPTEVTATPAPIEEVALAPIEAPVEAQIPGGGQVVVDTAEQERAAAARPAEVSDPWTGTDISEKDGKIDVSFGSETFGGQGLDGTISMLEGWILDPSQRPSTKVKTDQIVEVLSRLNSEKQRRAGAAAPVQAPVEASPPVEAPPAPVEAARTVEVPVPAEASAETPEQRFERRKQGFAGALAGLDRARSDTSGTEGEQKVRLAEAFDQAIGAAMEFMEEGDEAGAVVREFLAGALGTPGGRKLTEVAVRSRMDNAGVFQATTPEERKKKLEETGLLGLLTLLLELGMSFTDASVGAVVSEVQSATGAGR